MIKQIEIENFKCFSARTKIPLSNITICAGMNSVGKSTLIQALLLMWQSSENLEKKKVYLNTAALNLGNTNQITSGYMMLSADGECFQYGIAEDKLSLEFKLHPPYTKFQRPLCYLNAERLGPRLYQEMVSHDFLHCGHNGEYTFDVIQKHRHTEVSEDRCFIGAPRKSIRNLENQVEYWMSYIVNDVRVRFGDNISTQLTSMEVSQTALGAHFGSPYNFGFGISYVLPIITTGLIAQEGSMFIVENPEAHLHPAGQSRIGEFLAQISMTDVQVIVETHSEHVLNGIRKYALKNGVSPDNVCINYFSIESDGGKIPKYTHEVKRLLLNTRMDIMSWPEGFFDQESKDLEELRKLRGALK